MFLSATLTSRPFPFILIGSLSHKFCTIAKNPRLDVRLKYPGTKMYPASPVSPVMPDAKPKRNVPICSTVGDLEPKHHAIKRNRSLSQEDRRSASAPASAKKEHISPPAQSVSPRPRKRKNSPECTPEVKLGKRPKLAQAVSSTTPTMSLDINDIGMPGRSGSTRSRTKVPITERRRVPVA